MLKAMAIVIGIRRYGLDILSPMTLPVILDRKIAMAIMLRIKIMPMIFAIFSWRLGFLISNGRLIGLPFSILKRLM